jgi:aminopeptidase N
LREYLQRYRFGNASWPDLIALLDAGTPEDLAAWSHAWVDEAGRPIVTTELKVEGGRIVNLAFAVEDPFPPRGLTWTEELRVALGYPGRVQLLKVRLTGSRVEVADARGLPAPLFILPNGEGLGYGEFRLDPGSLSWLGDHLPDLDRADAALTRGSAWVTLWDAMLNGEFAASRLIELVLRALPRESDELNVQRILSYLEQAYWRFSPPPERELRSAEIERVLRRGLADASSTSLKGAYFATLRNVAVTPATLDWLARVWRQEETVPGLVLAETDYIVLAQELAVREIEGWDAMLREQVDRTQNPDRKARLQFVVPALSAEPSARDRFFASLADVANRRREPWVLDGLRYLHHPLRAGGSVKYVARSLELLQEIQQTGDIFFPKRWMDSTLGGHRSESAAAIVRSFLAHTPATYPDRLRRIVLSAADDLFRASRDR